jgi:hypothetical protein
MLKLIREPDNRFDPGGIKVQRRNGQQIGYIPTHVARDGDEGGIAYQMDAGVRFKCRVAGFSGGGFGMLYGVAIEITDGTW